MITFKKDPRRYTKIDDITPVDVVSNVRGFDYLYFKRDDLYLPFDDMPLLGGGKVRQTITLFNEIEHILNRYNGVLTYVSVGSPQGVIVVKVSTMLGYDTHITVGVNDSVKNIIRNHKPISECSKLGATVHNVAKIGYNNVLLAKSRDLADKEKLYIVHFGINIDDSPKALTDSISKQVQNIPDELDALIIPMGSGIQTAAILAGIKKYNKKVHRILGIQIAGYDRSKLVYGILEKLGLKDIQYENHLDKTYPYSTHVEYPIFNKEVPEHSFNLNVVYESKALEYVVKHRRELGLKRSDSVLYWVVGENNFLYD